MRDSRRNWSRRNFLRGCAGVSVASLTAGCGSNSEPSATVNTPGETETIVRTPRNTVTSTSEFERLEKAIEETVEGGKLIIDSEITLSSTIKLKSDIQILGEGGSIIAAPNSNVDLLRLENVSNIIISGVTFDGNLYNNNGNRLLGGVNLGDVSNVRITDCTFKNAANNAIEFQNKDGGKIEDVYVANNRFENNEHHACVFGVKNNGSSICNLIVENNVFLDTYEQLDVGIFALGDATAERTAILGNVSRKPNQDNTGTGQHFNNEGRVSNSIIYGNEIYGNPETPRSGMGVTKEARNCIIANNYTEYNNRATLSAVWDYYTPVQGPPQGNLIIKNDIYNAKKGFYYYSISGNIHVSDNRMRAIEDNIIHPAGNNTGENYVFYNNGPEVPASEVGPPESISDGDTWTDRDGNLLGTANWDRGSASPDDPVSVEVSTFVGE